MMNLLIKIFKDLSGNSNYVFKGLALLIKTHEYFDSSNLDEDMKK